MKVLAQRQGIAHRLRMCLGAALLAGILTGLTLALAQAGPERSFLHLATNLSDSRLRWSGFADIGVNPDGDRVVVVWPEDYTNNQTAARGMGNVWLRWASEQTGSGWSNPVVVHAGSSDICGAEAAVAVTGTTAHVAYLTKSPCTSPITHTVFYRTCPLPGACSDPQTVVSVVADPNQPALAGLDIALDSAGSPHLVYIQYQGGITGTVYYTSPHGGASGPAEPISAESHHCHSPAIAWSDGYVHIVWEDESTHQIMYRRKDSVWGEPKSLVQGWETYHPRNPAVAASGSRVWVTWDWEWPGTGNEPNRYVLAYARSNYSGTSWTGPLEVYTDGDLKSQDPVSRYLSTGEPDPSEYTTFLRPAVALDGEGKPTVVWHANGGSAESPDYDVWYTRGLTVTDDHVTWSLPEILNRETRGHTASPVVALAPLLSPTLQVAYLQFGAAPDDWETYYDSDQYDDYHHLYLPIVMRNYAGGGE